ncbi:MAG: GNAT family N-acetyltransferase [Anaerolineae bacterium]|nr:GNAT family N-acetyltransferase [Anaerolineae bacterium]
MTEITLRQMRPDDGLAIAALYESSPDTGRVALHQHFTVDPYLALTGAADHVVGVVAENNDTDIVGSGVVKFGRVRFHGVTRSMALLGNLVVHPDFRGRGIATALARRRIEIAHERYDNDVIILAGIQEQNAPSFAVAQGWMSGVAGQFESAFVPLLRRRPADVDEVHVRAVKTGELEIFADNLNAFYSDYMFAPEFSAESLAEWWAHSPIGRPIHHFYVAANNDGKLLAGLAIAESYYTREIHVRNMPYWMKALNRLVHVVPTNGIMRPLTVTRLWYAPAQAAALRYIWNSVRYQYRDQANALLLYFDPRSQLQDTLRLPFWLPRGRISLVAQCDGLPTTMSTIYPPV